MTRREFAALFPCTLLSAQSSPASQSRTAAISSARAAFASEVAKIGGGDYRKWFDSLANLRVELRKVMDAAPARFAPSDPVTKHYLFHATGPVPLFSELYAGDYVAPKAPDPFAWLSSHPAPEAIRATSRWLKKQGIDLIFVPVPKMSDVYIDRIVTTGVPDHRIVVPHIRKLFADLLASDVELLDLLPAFLSATKTSSDPLYLPADSHWSPSGRTICVRLLAERLARYPVVQAARKQPKLYTTMKTRVDDHIGAWPLLSPEERAAVEPFIHPEFDYVTRQTGKPYGNYDSAPILLIGDSFSDMIGPQLAHAINLPVAMMPTPGGTIQPVKELLRNRKAVSEAKVVIWVVNYAIIFLHDWSGLPDIVRRELPPVPKGV